MGVPRYEDVALRSVCENDAPAQVVGKVLPLLAGWLDYKEAALFVFDGNLLQDFLDAGGGFLVGKLA